MTHRSQRSRMRAARGAIVLVALLLTSAAVALAPPADAAKAKKSKSTPKAGAATRTGLENLESQVQEFTLANGLKFIVVPRRNAPVFSFATVVDAGAANDQVGTTGLAHMMEHMAFKGTPIIGTKDYAKEQGLLEAEGKAWDAVIAERRKGPKADPAKLAQLEKTFAEAQDAARAVVESNGFSKLVEQSGGQNLNAFTSYDITEYFYSLPSNRLELWALLEGSRMAHPVFREFYRERDVVIEERRMRYESSPNGRLILEFITAAYQAHPYGFGGIGHTSDLKSFSREEGDAFFKKHYVAKNMVIAVVGDVTTEDVRKHAEKYFADLSDAPKPDPIDTVEPEQKAERRVVLEDPGQPLVIIGWHMPAANDPRYASFKALADVMGGGEHSRLYKTLVKETKTCAAVFSGTGVIGEKYPGLIVVFAVPAAGQDPMKVEQQVYDVLKEMETTKPITDEELQGYKTRVRAEKIGQAVQNQTLASQLAEAQTFHGDWRAFFREQERVQSLTVANLQDAMKTALTKRNRTVGMIVTTQTAAAGGQ